jgi:membrane-anchored glycerophosphoryl diester phosphodiesterase (GDPDase)
MATSFAPALLPLSLLALLLLAVLGWRSVDDAPLLRLMHVQHLIVLMLMLLMTCLLLMWLLLRLLCCRPICSAEERESHCSSVTLRFVQLQSKQEAKELLNCSFIAS